MRSFADLTPASMGPRSVIAESWQHVRTTHHGFNGAAVSDRGKRRERRRFWLSNWLQWGRDH